MIKFVKRHRLKKRIDFIEREIRAVPGAVLTAQTLNLWDCSDEDRRTAKRLVKKRAFLSEKLRLLG